MSNELRKVTCFIAGEQYTLLGDEPQPMIMDAVARVDTQLRLLKKRMPDVDMRQLATLVALQLALEARKATDTLEAHNYKVDELSARVGSALTHLIPQD